MQRRGFLAVSLSIAGGCSGGGSDEGSPAVTRSPTASPTATERPAATRTSATPTTWRTTWRAAAGEDPYPIQEGDSVSLPDATPGDEIVIRWDGADGTEGVLARATLPKVERRDTVMTDDPIDPSEPELTADRIPRLEDPRFGPGTAAVVTGAASGIGRAPAHRSPREVPHGAVRPAPGRHGARAVPALEARRPARRGDHDGVGAIANMSSVHGHLATKDKPAYVVAAFALRGLTGAIAAEGGGSLRSFSVSVDTSRRR